MEEFWQENGGKESREVGGREDGEAKVGGDDSVGLRASWLDTQKNIPL